MGMGGGSPQPLEGQLQTPGTEAVSVHTGPGARGRRLWNVLRGR